MKARRPPSQTRLNRLTLWAGLWLARLWANLALLLGGDLSEEDRAYWRARLRGVETGLIALCVWRALERGGWPAFRHESARRKHDRRAGAAWRVRKPRWRRRATGRIFADPRLRSRDLVTRTAALRALHANMERAIERLIIRFKQILRSGGALVVTRPPARDPASGAPAHTIAAPNSS